MNKQEACNKLEALFKKALAIPLGPNRSYSEWRIAYAAKYERCKVLREVIRIVDQIEE